MEQDDQCLMTLEMFVHLLDEGQAAKESAHLVDRNGLVVGGGLTLKGHHGSQGKEVFIMVAQQVVKGDAAPCFLDDTLGKGTIEGVGMGEAAVSYPDHGWCGCRGYAGGESSKKEGVPGRERWQEGGGLVQSLTIETLKKDVIFKEENMAGSGRQPFLQAVDVGLKDPLFLIFRMLGNEHKFYPGQQADRTELFFGRFPPVKACIY